MKLYLLRHAEAHPVGVGAGDNDEDRPLTARGETQARAAAAELHRRRVALDAIVTSPYRRARATAAIVAGEGAAAPPVESDPRLAPGSDPEPVLDLLAAHPAAVRLLLVSHMPLIGVLLARLAGDAAPDPTFHTAGMAALSLRRLLPAPVARLEWFLSPDSYPTLG